VVDDVPVRQVLQALAETEKQNVIIAPEVSGDVTLHLVNVPWQVAFQTVVETSQLHWHKEGTILRVYPAEWQQRQQQEQEQARLQRLNNQPLDASALCRCGGAGCGDNGAGRQITGAQRQCDGG